MLWRFLHASATGSSSCRKSLSLVNDALLPDRANVFSGSYFGRRTVYVVGMAAMAVELCLIGILNVWTSRTSVAWAQAILTLVWTFTFQLSAGQLGNFI